MVQRWKYLSQVFEGYRLQEELDELGEAGWELITAHWEEFTYGGRTQLQARCILKRPVDDSATGEGGYRVGWEPATAGLA